MPSGSHLTCTNCHAPTEVRTQSRSYFCSHCHTRYDAIRCGECDQAYLTSTPAWSSSQCPECGHVEKRRYSADAALDEVKGLLTPGPLSGLEGAESVPLRPSLGEYLAERGRLLGHAGHRIWPAVVSVVFVILGLLYCFRWDSTVLHIPSAWVWPNDLWGTYRASSAAAHGHFGGIYSFGFLEFPGIVLALAPLGALSGVLHTSLLQIATANRHVPAVPQSLIGPGLLGRPVYHTNVGYLAAHPQWVILVEPYALMLSCTALFAFDALAERFGISRSRRRTLCVTEAVLLWEMTVRYGHPEDALAVALAVYALIFALEGRFAGCGWLLGFAIAFQPLVVLMVPVILAMAGRRNLVAIATRSVIPAAALVAIPLFANYRATFHALFDQPSSPTLNHVTPWTTLSPHLANGLVAAGPIRILGVALAVGIGIWVSRRSITRPDLLAWACALGIALRCYTESVMTPYYPWGTLAVAVVVAGRRGRVRFAIAMIAAIATTLLAEQHLGWMPWWTIQVGGLTGVLLVASPWSPVHAYRGVDS